MDGIIWYSCMRSNSYWAALLATKNIPTHTTLPFEEQSRTEYPTIQNLPQNLYRGICNGVSDGCAIVPSKTWVAQRREWHNAYFHTPNTQIRIPEKTLKHTYP